MNEVLDYRRTVCLQQVIETGSVRGAAEVLGLDPSVISRTVAKLERDIGVALLERRGRGVVATDAGILAAQFARRQQAMSDTFLAEINKLRHAKSGHIELALGEGFVDLVMGLVLQGFLREHPDITCNVTVAGTEETVTLLVEDSVHMAFIFQPPTDVRLRSHYSRASPVRVHVHRDHPLAGLRRELRLTDLEAYPGATLTDAFGLRHHIRAAEIDENVTLRNMLVTNSFKVLWEFAVTGLGYILTPRSLPQEGPRLAQLANLPLANAILNSSRSHVATRAGRHLPPAATALLQHIVKTFPQL